MKCYCCLQQVPSVDTAGYCSKCSGPDHWIGDDDGCVCDVCIGHCCIREPENCEIVH